MKPLYRDYRIIILTLLIVFSLVSLVSPWFFKKSGVFVSYVSGKAKCENVKIGDRITDINGVSIQTYQNFIQVLKSIKKGDYVPLVSNGMPASCIALNDSDIGFEVREVKPTSLKFGIDIQGGTRVLLQGEGNATTQEISDAATILNERINMYGLSDIRVVPVGSNLIQIEAAGLTEDDIRNFLAKQGVFEGKILEQINLVNGKGDLIFNGKHYPVRLNDTKIEIKGKTYSANQTFKIGGVNFEIYNITKTYMTVFADIFTGKDIITVFTDPQHNYVVPSGNGYRFAFAIQISKESAERFANVTKGQPTYVYGGQTYIKPKIVLFMDKKPISTLNIVANLAGEAVSTPSIEGGGRTAKEAQEEKLRLQTILRSGSLPVKLKIARVDTITQTAGKRMIDSTIYVVIAAAIAVAVIVFLRYRSLKIALPIIGLSLSEILLILGIASSQVLAGLIVLGAIFIGVYYKEIKGLVGWLTVATMVIVSGYVIIAPWTLDIPAIAGLIAVLGTGANQMIIIADEILLDKEKDIETRHKTAMEIINNSASMVTFAMVPLVFLGIGTLKGFAITTIAGVLVGLLITRPAYMSIIERLKHLK